MKNKKIKKIFESKNKKPIVCLTAYSATIAQILDKHCDIILVGDSLGTVLYNMKSTQEVTLDMIINHAKSVKKGIKKTRHANKKNILPNMDQKLPKLEIINPIADTINNSHPIKFILLLLIFLFF